MTMEKYNWKNEKELLTRFNKFINNNEDKSWKQVSDMFGQRSSSTVYQWYHDQKIPRSQWLFCHLILKIYKH